MGTVGRVLRGLGIAWMVFALAGVLAGLLGYVDIEQQLVSLLKLGLGYGVFRAGTWLKNGAAKIALHDARKAATETVEADATHGQVDEFGMCPNCKKPVLLAVEGCEHCGASFGENSSWKPTPLKTAA